MPADSSRAVFLSYASQDAAAARRICDALRAVGVEVWFDQSELVGGDAWDAKIRGQIKECALFLPIISASTQARAEGYFRIEWRLADRRTELMGKLKAFLVPICIDDTRDADADVPDSFLTVQWTRLPAGETSPKFCERVKSLLAGEVSRTLPAASSTRHPGAATGASAPAPQSGRPAWRRPALAWIAAAVAALGLVAWLAQRRDAPSPLPITNASAHPSAAEKTAAPLLEARKLLARARKILDDGDDTNRENYAIAEGFIRRAADLDGTDGEVWAAWSQLSADLFRYGLDRTPARREALRSQTERASRLAPDSVEVQVAIAGAADYLGLDQSATESTLRAVALRAPDNWRVLMALGRKLGRAGKVDEGAEVLARADALADSNPMPWVDASAYFIAAGRYAEAETAIAKSLARRPSARALVWDAVLRFGWRGDAKGAAAALAQWPPWSLLEDRGASVAGVVWLWNRQPDKALAVFQRMPRDFLRDSLFTGPRAALTAIAHTQAGNAAAARDDWALARQACDRELAATPGDYYSLYWKAWALNQLGDRPAAEAIRQSLEQRDWAQPTFYSPEAKWAGVLLTLGHPDEALTFLQATLDRESQDQRVSFKNQFVNYRLTRAALELNPLFDPLRDDERFKRLVARAPASADNRLATTTDQKAIAVLAFDNRSDEKSSDAFSDGISEELLNVLQKVPGLTVKARNSSFYFKGRNATPQEIGEKLSVAHFVSGSVQRLGNEVRIFAQLSRTDTGDVVWSERFTGELNKPWELQERIAGRIAEELKLKLGATTQARKTVNPEAYRFVLEGRHFWNLRTDESLGRAEAAFRRALELEGDFAEAHAGLASVALSRGWYLAIADGSSAQEREHYARARAEAERALVLDPNLAEPYAALGAVLFSERRFDEAERQFERALALNPSRAVTHHWYSILLFGRGRIERGIEMSRQAVSLDPLQPTALWNAAAIGIPAGALAESLAYSDRALVVRPGFLPALADRAIASWLLGRKDEAVAAARAITRDPDSEIRWEADWFATYVLHHAGLDAEADAHIQRISAKLAPGNYRLAFMALARGGNAESLVRMGELPAICLSNFYTNPIFDSVREDARFAQTLAKLGYQKEYELGRATIELLRKEQAPKK